MNKENKRKREIERVKEREINAYLAIIEGGSIEQVDIENKERGTHTKRNKNERVSEKMREREKENEIERER